MNKVIGTYVFVAAIAVFGIGATPAYAQYDNWYTDSGYGGLTDFGSGFDNWYTDSGYGSLTNYGGGYDPYAGLYDNWYTDSGYGALTDYTGAYDPYAGLYDNWYTDSGYGSLADYSGAYDPYAGAYDPYAGAYDPYAGAYDPYVGAYDPYAGAYDPYAGAYDPYCSQDCSGSQYNQPVYDQNCGCMTYPSVQRSMAMYQPFTQQQYTQPPMPIQPPPIPSVCPPNTQGRYPYCVTIYPPQPPIPPVPPPQPDICPNLPGIQTTVPAGYILQNGQCVPPQQLDICPNLPGIQTTVPAGYTLQNGQCVPATPPPVTDLCPNLPGLQTTVPTGYTLQNGQCVPITVPPPIIPPVPIQPPPIINTCVGYSCNTNTITTISQLNPVTPAPIVQYTIPSYPQYPVYPTPQYPVYPTPTYPQQGLYCVITASPSSIQNGQAAILSWTSYGATSATLSDGLGRVAVNGSLAVRPEASRVYTLTIYGQAGSRSCTTSVNVFGSAPHISLSQIPYTGFDLGPIGNAMYWLALATFAIAGAYLVVYYLPSYNTFAFATTRKSGESVRSEHIVASDVLAEEVSVAPIMVEAPTNVFDSLPVAGDGSTKDIMTMARAVDGTPRIVINRE